MNSVKMFHENDQRSFARRETTTTTTITGNRPSPLKISRDSHLIHKQQQQQQQQPSRMAAGAQRKQPVIIYTHSPKVIHTRPHDFMALVQRLTGRSPSDVDIIKEEEETHNETLHHHEQLDNETSSGVTDEINVVGADVIPAIPNRSFSGFSPIMQQQNQLPYFADIPMFTPTSMDHHHFLSSSSPRPLYRFSDSTSSQISPSTLCGSISPSMIKFIKGLPEY